MVLKRVGVGSAAKVMGALYAGIGLIIGFLIACAALLGGAIGAWIYNLVAGFAGGLELDLQ